MHLSVKHFICTVSFIGELEKSKPITDNFEINRKNRLARELGDALQRYRSLSEIVGQPIVTDFHWKKFVFQWKNSARTTAIITNFQRSKICQISTRWPLNRTTMSYYNNSVSKH